jgi:ABC-type multidrug transport system fused ATPase/permease subunit
VVVVENAARLSLPWLVARGIDRGLPPIMAGGSARTLLEILAVMVIAVVLQSIGRISFLRISGRIGQAVLLSLRRRVFAHFQRLDVAFHDRYTSGRVTSRLTSDIDAITELLAGGFDGLVTAVLTMVGVGILMLSLDLSSAWSVCSLPAAGAARALVRAYVGRGLPQGARDVGTGHCAVRGDDDGYPRRSGVSARAAQRRDLR